MEPILISFSICVVGVMGAVSLFSLAMRGGGDQPDSGDAIASTKPAGSFFLEEPREAGMHTDIPTDGLVLQLERHFRMEEQAAAAFLEGPTPDALHAPSFSPFWD
jgi:hypothetical protein